METVEEVETISYSQANAWARCPYKWYLSYDQKWIPKTKSPGLALGSMVDELLTAHYQGKNWEALTEIAKEWLTSEEADLYLINRALGLVERYVKDYAPVKDANWKILDVQKYFNVEFPTPKGNVFNVEGYLDLLIEVASKVWLVENKTYGGNQWIWTPKQLQMEVQSPTYIAALRKLGVDVFGVIWNQLNTWEYKNPATVDKLFHRDKIYKTPAELDNVITQLGHTIDEIIEAKKNGGPYRKHLCRDCDWCPYQEPCLYDNKGIDPTHFLEVSFKKKEPRPDKKESEPEKVEA